MHGEYKTNVGADSYWKSLGEKKGRGLGLIEVIEVEHTNATIQATDVIV